MPREIADSFTARQISAIDAAMRKRESRRQPVDLRFSVPFLRWRFFVVLLLGPERRSPKRRAQDRLKHAVFTLFNLLTLLFLLLFTIPAAIGLVHLISNAMNGG